MVVLAEVSVDDGGGDGGNCTMGSDAAGEVDCVLLLTSVTVGVAGTLLSFGVVAVSLGSLSSGECAAS